MRKLFLLLGLLVCFSGLSQNPDYHRFGARSKYYQPDTLSTTQRDALTPKLGTILYHKDTGISQWEQWDGTDWVEFGGDTSGFVTLDTDQTITGAKTFDTGDADSNIVSNNAGANFGIESTNTGDGSGIYSLNTGNGVALHANNQSAGQGIFVFNSSTGDGVKVSNSSSGPAIVANGFLPSTGFNYVGKDDGTNTFTVDKEGNVTANDFIGSWNGIPSITGAASTIVTSDLTNNRALISNGSGKVAVSAVTSTELSYVDGVTSALQTQLDSKLPTASYTAADVLSKLLTVDGSGSGLDADLLRGVHWGNVNTNIVTTGSVTATSKIRGASDSGINGTGTGTSNIATYVFYESNGTTRQGYVGFPSGSNSDLYLRNDITVKDLRLRETGALTYNGPGEFTGTVSGSDPVNSDDFVTKGYGESNFATVESGTFTPVATSSTAYVYSATANGRYTKIHDVVYYSLSLTSINDAVGTPTGNLRVDLSDIPYSMSSNNGISVATFLGMETSYIYLSGITLTGPQDIGFKYKAASSTGDGADYPANVLTGLGEIRISGWYFTND